MDTFVTKLASFDRVFVLTGAGISLSSGIPTYRDSTGQWTGSQPIQHGDFLRYPHVRQRYWARSLVGWPSFARAKANIAHEALAQAESLGAVELLVTQNVDRLHQQAGSSAVVDLHGRLDQVICLTCADVSSRHELQLRLEQENAGIHVQAESLRPDGDAEVAQSVIDNINLPSCERCGGVLKPDVVFFGDTVPKQRVVSCQSALAHADALLVVGSSLQVYSGFRFCRQAAQQGTPIFSINPGKTRADDLFSASSGKSAATLLPQWVNALKQRAG